MNIQLKNIFFLLIIKGLIMSNTTNAAPYFGVDIDLYNVAVDIRVNDVPVYFDDEKGQLTVEVPAPDSVIDGVNILSLFASFPIIDGVNMDSAYEAGAYASATLFRQDGDSPKKKLSSVIIKFNPDGIEFVETQNYLSNKKLSPELVISKHGKVIVTESVEIKSPFLRWAWQDGKNIENTQENYDSLIEAYREIHTNLETKNKEKLFPLYSQRAKEIAIAYSLGGEIDGHEKISTGKDMVDDKLDLYPFRTDYKGIRLDIFGGGRLARIVVNDSFHQPILFTEPKAGLYHFHKFSFYLNKDNQWIMIR